MKRLTIGLGLLVLVSGCDGHTALNGEVVGPDGQPVVGAKVRLSERDHQERWSDHSTDQSGHFSVGLTHAPVDLVLVVTVTKDGYKPFRKEFKVSERESFPKKIVLEPEPKGP